MLECLSNKVTNPQTVRPATLLKRNLSTGVLEPTICRCSARYVFLKNLQNSPESNCVEVSFQIKCRNSHSQMFFKTFFKNNFAEHLRWLLLTVLGLQFSTLLKKRLRQRCFCCQLCKFFKNTFLTEHCMITVSCVDL